MVRLSFISSPKLHPIKSLQCFFQYTVANFASKSLKFIRINLQSTIYHNRMRKNMSYAALTPLLVKSLPHTRTWGFSLPPRRHPSTLLCPSFLYGRQIQRRSARSTASHATSSRSCSPAMHGAWTSWSLAFIPQPRRRRCLDPSTAHASCLSPGMCSLLAVPLDPTPTTIILLF